MEAMRCSALRQPPTAALGSRAPLAAPRHPAAPLRLRRHAVTTAALKAKSSRQVCCSKTLVSRPESVDKVQELCAGVASFSQARIADRSSGVLVFDCMRDQWEVGAGLWTLASGRACSLPATQRDASKLQTCTRGRARRRAAPTRPGTQMRGRMPSFVKRRLRHASVPATAARPAHPWLCLQPNVFHFWERYESNVALGRHNTMPEVSDFMNRVSSASRVCAADLWRVAPCCLPPPQTILRWHFYTVAKPCVCRSPFHPTLYQHDRCWCS